MLRIKQGRLNRANRKCHAARHLATRGKAAIRHFLALLAWFLGYSVNCVALKRAPTLSSGTAKRRLGSRRETLGNHWLDSVGKGWHPLKAKV